jgi:hypothetical protein
VARPLHLLLPALIALAPYAVAVELRGTVHSPTGVLPAKIEVLADRRDKLPAIAGTIENGRYRIELPDTGNFRLRLQAKGWEAPPKYIWHPTKAGALDFLIYPTPVPEPLLAEELIRMGQLDQDLRAKQPSLSDREFWLRFQAEDKKREDRLSRIIDEKGWPSISQVGHEAANSAWLIAQHGTPEFLKRCLVLMQAASAKHEIALSSLALSIDRDLTNEGKKQVYGSQFQTNEDGHTFALPIEDMDHLDERRFSMGLEPFEDYRKRLEK